MVEVAVVDIEAALVACTPALHDDDRAALEQHLAAAAAILGRAR